MRDINKCITEYNEMYNKKGMPAAMDFFASDIYTIKAADSDTVNIIMMALKYGFMVGYKYANNCGGAKNGK